MSQSRKASEVEGRIGEPVAGSAGLATEDDSIHEFDRMTRDQLRRLAPHAVAVVPLGSTEQHGPHLAAGTDSIIVTEVARRAAQLTAVPTVLLPTLTIGVAGHHLPFGATLSIDVATYLDLLTQIGQSLVRSGFTRVLFINGHGGNDASVRAVGSRLVVDHQLPVTVAATSYWQVAKPALSVLEDRIGPIPGHAGSFETSCLLAIDSTLVRSELLPAPEQQLQPLARSGIDGSVVNRPGVWEISDGRTDDAAGAGQDLGHQALALISQRVADVIEELHQSTVMSKESDTHGQSSPPVVVPNQ